MRRHLLVLAATALLATSCASESTAPPASGEPDPSASTSAPELAVNGSVYATDWADDTLPSTARLITRKGLIVET